MNVKFRFRGERDTAVRTSDYFLFGMTPHVISEFVQTGIFAIASGPFAIDPVFDSVAARQISHVYRNVIQVHLVIRE